MGVFEQTKIEFSILKFYNEFIGFTKGPNLVETLTKLFDQDETQISTSTTLNSHIVHERSRPDKSDQ